MYSSTVRHRLCTLATACALSAACAGASAALVTSTWSGTVTGSYSTPRALDSFPIGTAVSWAFSFDDSFRGLSVADLSGSSPRQAIDGWLQVGSDRVDLDEFDLYSFTYNATTQDIISYQPKVTGTGPLTSSGGGDFSGLFFSLSPALDVRSAPYIGYRFVTGSGANYSYLTLDGSGSTAPTASVSAPATLGLTLAGLGLLAAFRRPRRIPREA